ncbi:flagellar biosynthetic protein FliR [bacterium]|nr:flagellar biosynthetic protein FliR [bacterium]
MDTSLLAIFTPLKIILFIAVFTRISGLLASAPLFSTYPIPYQVKIWLCAMIAFIMFPFVQSTSSFIMPTVMPELIVILIKEFLIGYLIGFCTNLIFVAVDMAANMFSIQMSLSASQALNPTTGTTSPVLTQVYTLMASMVFISLNAHQWLFSAVYNSFTSVPVGYGFFVNGKIVQECLYLTGQMFSVAVGLALPIFGILLIKDVLMGFVSKMMPQMNVFMVAMPLKIYVGLILGMVFVRPMAEYIAAVIEKTLTAVMVLF